MTAWKPGDRALLEVTVGARVDGGFRIPIGTTGLHVKTDELRPVPPDWAVPLPDGVWPATVAEVRARGLEWAAATLDSVASGHHLWYTECPIETYREAAVVFAREPVPAPPADVTVTIPGDLAARIDEARGAGELGRWDADMVDLLDLIPPTTSEIIAAIDRGDRVKQWNLWLGKWIPEPISLVTARHALNINGDQPQPGYRIVRGES